MKSKYNFLRQLVLVLLSFCVIRPLKAVRAGLTAFAFAMGAPGGVLANIWTSNQNADAPVSSGVVTIAQGTPTGTLSAELGLVTVTGLTTAAGLIQTITITNTTVTTSSMVFATLNNYSGTWTTNGEPTILAATTSANTIVVHIANMHGANALAGNVTFSLLVHQPVL